MKHTLVNTKFSGHIDAEPGVLVGPKRKLVKAFDCSSKGAPPASIIGVCVGFKSCAPVTPPAANTLAELDCSGPKLRLLLVRTEAGLAFQVADADHPLAKRKMSTIPVPSGTEPAVGAFQLQNVSASVDL